MRTCDAVVLPISFGESDRNLCEFNVATKLSELLASGTVILAVGPEYAAMTKLLQSAGAAQIVTNPGVPELARAAFLSRTPPIGAICLSRLVSCSGGISPVLPCGTDGVQV